MTSLTDKYYSIDSEDDFRSGCRNVSHQQQFFSELPSPGRSHNTNYINLFWFLTSFVLIIKKLLEEVSNNLSQSHRVLSQCPAACVARSSKRLISCKKDISNILS